jgi:hypothetical protein
MKLRINLKQGLAAAALVSTAAFTVACSSATAGTPSVGGTVAATSASAAPTTSASSSSTSSPTSSHSRPSDPSTEVDDPTVTVVVDPAALDATTEAWLENSCTDIGTLIGSLFAVPTVDDTATDEEYRDAYVTYYGDLTDTLLGMTDRMAALDAPTFAGGQDLHDGYLAYLNDLSSITLGAAVIIQQAPDRASVDAAVEQVNGEIEQLGQSDYGLSDFQGEELQALMAQVPACEGLLSTT